jgi:mannose-1-phosphate guanylyltransferase / phosphomannomutase
MEAAVFDVTFAGASDGGCIWPDFLPAYDAAVTLVKMLDLLAQVDRPLSTVCATLPAVHVAHETIVTPWERKGTVMREIVEKVGNRQVELIDGVKIIDHDRWALVLPDPEDALTHVWAEATTDQDARRLAQEYVQRIRQILR